MTSPSRRTAASWHAGAIGRQVILPIAALVAGAMAFVGDLVLYVAAEENALAVESSARLGRNALDVARRRIAELVKDYAWWDEAVDHLHATLDLEWADENVGRWVHEELGLEMSFVLAPDGRTAYA